MACDLHMHSNFSDGTRSPAQLIDEACALGLSAVALTDHNTAAGIGEFTDAARGKPIKAVGGAEFSVDCHGAELHLLGLFLTPERIPEVEAFCRDYLARKDYSNRLLCKRLQEAGYPVSYDLVAAKAGKQHNLNRSHIAEVLVNAKVFKEKRDAFHSILASGHGYYDEPERIPVFDAIPFIHSIGGVAVVAHPYHKDDSRNAVIRYMPELLAAGLDGIETVYSEYDTEKTAQAKRLAAEYRLLQSGGSDYHGAAKPEIFMGKVKAGGDLNVPDAFFDELKHRAETFRR